MEDDDMDDLPLAGVFCAAIWAIDETRLFLAAAHEDREVPFILMMGAE
jgi:hypothetical protein